MATIADIRKQYPDYSDLSDRQLADAVHAKFYADMPRSEFEQKIGLTDRTAPALASARNTPAPKETFLQGFNGLQANFNRGTGLGDEIAAAGRTGLDMVTGHGVKVDPEFSDNPLGQMSAMGKNIARSTAATFTRDLANERGLEDSYSAAHPNLAALGRGTGAATTMLLPAAKVVQGPSMLANAARGAVTAGVTAAGYAAADRGTAAERLHAASRAASNPIGLGLGAAGGALATPPRLKEPADNALGQMAKAKPDIEAMRARAQDYRDVGIEPTLTDVADESGRGVIRAAASKMTPGRQVAQDFADRRALDLPSRIARQANSVAPESASAPAPADWQSAATNLASEIAPGEADAGSAVSSALGKQFKSAQGKVNAAYDAARAAAADQAHVPMAEKPVIASNLREAVAGYDPESVPRVARVLEGMDGLGTVTARDLFEARTRLTNLRVSNDAVEAGAASKAVKALDAEIERVAPTMTGDPKAVGAWQAAIDQRRAFGKQFEGGDLVHSLTEQANRGGGMALAVSPEDAANHILGRSPLGFIGKPNLNRDLVRLRVAVGPDSQEWKALSGEVYQRLLAGSSGSAGVDGAKLASNLDRLGKLGDLFFSPAQRARIGAIAEGMQRPSAVDVGGAITAPDTDAFVADVGRLPPEELPAAQRAAARAIGQRAGNSIGHAPGLARTIAEAPEQQARNAALFGDAAPRLEQGMRLEERAAINARDIAPRTGAQTQLRTQDALETAQGVARTGGRILRGDAIGAAIEATKLWLKSRGMNAQQAEDLVRLATTPGQTDKAIDALSRLTDRSAATRFVRSLNDPRAAGVPALSAPAAAGLARAAGVGGASMLDARRAAPAISSR